MANVAAVTKRVSDVEKELDELLIEAENLIAPDKRAEFANQIELMLLNSNVKLIEMCSKVANAGSVSGSDEFPRKWRDLRTKSESLRRRSQLLSCSPPEDIEATLMWMAERGTEEDLSLLRRARKLLPRHTENLERLFDIAERRIGERASGSVK